ncbi:MAG: hydroxyacid dehydrogenase [Clostridium sp.]|nr:hydroxyacid dehydrogenase [Clostridium sp.]
MKLFITMPHAPIPDSFFTPEVMEALEHLGEVERNPYERDLTEEELIAMAGEAEILVTGWGTCYLEKRILLQLPKLRLIAHTAGSVAILASPDIYETGVRVVSGNDIFAQSVAEGCLCYILSALRRIEHYTGEIRSGRWLENGFENKGLIGKRVGIVGFGAIAKYFLELIRWFRCEILIYSSHLTEEEAAEYGGRKAGLEEIFSTCDVVSVHYSLTPATEGLVSRQLLEMLGPDALLVNTSRGKVIDEQALFELLEQGRFSAALDVYEEEPLKKDNPIRKCKNVLLMPHMAGPTVDMRKVVAAELAKDIQRFVNGEKLAYEITEEQAKRMTRG